MVGVSVGVFVGVFVGVSVAVDVMHMRCVGYVAVDETAQELRARIR